MTYSVNFLAHVKAIRKCLPLFEGHVRCNIGTGVLEVRARGKCVELQPQFAHRREDTIGYFHKLTADTEFFIGWRPYFNRMWPLSYDKRAFKEFCRQNQLSTPRGWSSAQDVTANVLVKHATSSFSRNISGPYLSREVKSGNRHLQQTEYFEEFIPGDIVKIWYWNTIPVVLEVLPMPTVVGDGKRTLRKLIDAIRAPHMPGNDWPIWQGIAEFQGLTLDSIVPSGQRVLVDFRYLSALHPVPPDIKNLNLLSSYEGTPMLRQIREAGAVFWSAIPAEIRPNTLFSVDAIADASQRLMFLEMNCNPIVHPDAYLPMFESLFGAATAQQSAPSATRLQIAAAG